MANLYTEHTLKLPDGIEILYTDSGAPNTPDYTTLVVLHGFGFSGYGFVRLHEYAHKHNMRAILCNRRGYHGSTKYTEEEVADMRAGRKVFQDRLAMQIAWFFQHFIENEGTPKVSADRTAGGFILMGWSWGNATSIALLADPAVIPTELYRKVEPHVRSLVIYDPPFLALGYPRPELAGAYDPFSDPDCTTPEAVYDNFQHWVTSYYNHPNLASGDPSGMSFEKRTEKRTLNQWTAEETAKYIDTLAAAGADTPGFEPPMQAMLKIQSHQALFDADRVRSFFPDVNVLYITGEQTAYYCMWAFLESSRLYSEALGRGETPRPTKFKLVLGGNHYLHYDTPEELIREILDGCASK